jgi:chromosome segregation ATPase
VEEFHTHSTPSPTKAKHIIRTTHPACLKTHNSSKPTKTLARETSLQKLSLIEEALLGILENKEDIDPHPNSLQTHGSFEQTVEALNDALTLLEERRALIDALKTDCATVVEAAERERETKDRQVAKLTELNQSLHQEQFDLFLVLKQMRQKITQLQIENNQLVLLAQVKDDMKEYQDKLAQTSPLTDKAAFENDKKSTDIAKGGDQNVDKQIGDHTETPLVREIRQENERLTAHNEHLVTQVEKISAEMDHGLQHSNKQQMRREADLSSHQQAIQDLQFNLACSKQREDFLASELESTRQLNEQLEKRLSEVENEVHDNANQQKQSETHQRLTDDYEALLRKLSTTEQAQGAQYQEMKFIESKYAKLRSKSSKLEKTLKECQERLREYEDMEPRLVQLEALGVVRAMEIQEFRRTEEESYLELKELSRDLTTGLQSEDYFLRMVHDTLNVIFSHPLSETKLEEDSRFLKETVSKLIEEHSQVTNVFHSLWHEQSTSHKRRMSSKLLSLS